MKTINITFSEENIEDLQHALFIYETNCLLDDHKFMYEATSKLRKYIDQQTETNRILTKKK